MQKIEFLKEKTKFIVALKGDKFCHKKKIREWGMKDQWELHVGRRRHKGSKHFTQGEPKHFRWIPERQTGIKEGPEISAVVTATLVVENKYGH